MSQPLVSIIIPTYNRGHLIERAILSVRNQRYTNWQLIVIDDGSTDDTRQRLVAFDDIIYSYQPNKGQAAARNAGLPFCQGEYIASLDSDDEWHPNFLADGMAMLEKNKLDFVFMNWQTNRGMDGFLFFFLRSSHRKRYCVRSEDNWWLLTPQQNRQLMVETCPTPSSSLIIRRSSFPVAWNEQMLIADDWCMVLDMVMNRACHSAFTEISHWTKTIHGDNIYDCRNYTEVIPALGFHDEQLLLKRFSQQLTYTDKRVFRRRLALHHFNYAYFGWKQAVFASPIMLRHLMTAFRLSPSVVGHTLFTWGLAHAQRRLTKAKRLKSISEPVGSTRSPLPATNHEMESRGALQTTVDEPATQHHPVNNESNGSAAMPRDKS